MHMCRRSQMQAQKWNAQKQAPPTHPLPKKGDKKSWLATAI
jgi:hypothetical protein